MMRKIMNRKVERRKNEVKLIKNGDVRGIWKRKKWSRYDVEMK
jgi:hypothetical protein